MFAIKPRILGIILTLYALSVFFLGLNSSHVHAIVSAQQSSIDWRDITHTIIEVPVTIGYLVGGIASLFLKQWAKLLVLVSVSISLIFTITDFVASFYILPTDTKWEISLLSSFYTSYLSAIPDFFIVFLVLSAKFPEGSVQKFQYSIAKIKTLHGRQLEITEGKKRKIRQILFAIVLGIAVAIFLNSLLLIWMGNVVIKYFHLWFFILFVIPIFCVTKGVLWIFRRELLSDVPWIVIAFIAILGWPLCNYVPVGIRISQLRFLTKQEIPLYPDTKRTRILVQPVAMDAHGYYRVSLVMKTPADREDIVPFYQRELRRRGWKVSNKKFPFPDDTTYWFEKEKKFLTVDTAHPGKVEITLYLK
ncbi:MAG: hypothetical protein E3K36_09985 [Candidatus Brocadia sp.]|nr:hypothetical protein [Candidatus Brocadia sp.]